MISEEPWERLLRDSLTLLALAPDEQVSANGLGGCVACDLLANIDNALRVALGGEPVLTEGQQNALARIVSTIEDMKKQDLECFNNDVLMRPLWNELRALAVDGLRLYAWDAAVVSSN